MVSPDNPMYIEMRKYLEVKDYKSAFSVYKKNPLLQLAEDDARQLLNHINELDPNKEDIEKNLKQTIDASVLLYRRLSRQKLLKAFDCVNNAYPDNCIEVSPAQLEEKTGLPMSALTPKQRTTYWRLAGLAFCIFEFWFGNTIGVDPVFTLIPATLILLLSDQLFYRGAAFETVYRALLPEYGRKIVCHEAGHFLVAYLLGIPVRGCVTNAWDAARNPEVFGQAGTIFYDSKMADEMQQQQVKRSSLDRLSVVTMAGIAAEALQFGTSEGGIADEQSLINLLGRSISPPWTIMRIQGQARWAVLQAIKLIQEHQDAYDAVVKALEEGKGVGDVIMAIESNLPAELPSLQRQQEREERLKRSEKGSLLDYVRKMTWNVGGIMQDSSDSEEPNKEPENIASVVEQQQEFIDSKTEAVAKFTERMKLLETAVRSGDLDIDAVANGSALDSAQQSNKNFSSSSSGGVWLNNLKALDGDSTTVGTGAAGSSIEMPKPIEGYEKAIEQLSEQEAAEAAALSHAAASSADASPAAIVESSVDMFAAGATAESKAKASDAAPTAAKGASITTSPAAPSLSGAEMLRTNRGFQMKQLELIEMAKSIEKKEAERRLAELRKQLTSASKK